MTAHIAEIIETDAPIANWFGVGGRADTLARPRTLDELRDLLVMFAGKPIRVLGDGANLLVDDEGVDGVVLSLEHFDDVEYLGFDPADDTPTSRPRSVIVRAGAGHRLPHLIIQTVRLGIAGLETLAGIPASVGGAAFMNAGGAFGQIADAIDTVHAVTRLGDVVAIPHDQLAFDYRHSGLGWLVITAVDFDLTLVPEERRPRVRQRLKDVMTYKKGSQPLGADSAGCVFKNPVVGGAHVSAGRLIDLAGCKGMRIGGAEVSRVHANFIVTREGCAARDVLDLIEAVKDVVRERAGVELETEIAIWRRADGA